MSKFEMAMKSSGGKRGLRTLGSIRGQEFGRAAWYYSPEVLWRSPVEVARSFAGFRAESSDSTSTKSSVDTQN